MTDYKIAEPPPEPNTTVSIGNMRWRFRREKKYTWLQIKMLRFCLGMTVEMNDAGKDHD